MLPILSIRRKECMEQDMDHPESLYHSVFDHSMEAVFLTTPDGVVLAANPAACKLFGCTEEEMCQLGRNGLVDASSPQFGDFLAKRASTGSARAELIFIRGDGSRFPGEASSNQFIDGQQKLRTIVTIRDLSARSECWPRVKSNIAC